MSGFTSVRREQLRLTVGFQAKVDVVLKIGAVSESITVSGQSPVVDVTTTATRTELTREVLDLIPTGRNGLTALLTQTPGVRSNLDVGGVFVVPHPDVLRPIVGVDARTGRVAHNFHHGHYVPASGDGMRLLLHGYSSLYAVEPVRSLR